MKTKIEKYTDGVVTIYSRKERKSNFGARLNDEALSDLEKVAFFNFEEKSKRIQDIEFADALGFSLSLKIKIPKNNLVDSDKKAVVNNSLYSIRSVDSDGKCCYLYLEYERELKRC